MQVLQRAARRGGGRQLVHREADGVQPRPRPRLVLLRHRHHHVALAARRAPAPHAHVELRVRARRLWGQTMARVTIGPSRDNEGASGVRLAAAVPVQCGGPPAL